MSRRHLIIFLVFSGIVDNMSSSSTPIKGILALGKHKTAWPSLTEYLHQCMLEFVASMGTGIPELDIPAFDPWITNENFPSEVRDNAIQLIADVNATKVESIGFSSANITSAELNASDKTYNISIALPDLFVKGMYSLVGTHHYFYPVVGAGPFDITLFDVSTTGITTLVLIDGDIIQLTPIKLNLLYYRSSVPNFENLSITGSAAFPGTQKAVTSALSDSTWRAIEREFLEQLSTSITEYLNQELKEFGVPDIGDEEHPEHPTASTHPTHPVAHGSIISH